MSRLEVEPVTTDRHGRTVAFVRVGATLVNKELIRQGLAWVFTRYCDRPICQGWKKLEVEARHARQRHGLHPLQSSPKLAGSRRGRRRGSSPLLTTLSPICRIPP